MAEASVIWHAVDVQGHLAWQADAVGISMRIVPDFGGKTVSLVNARTGREWLWGAGRQLHHRGYASPYHAGDGSGWDEMFPTIDACTYPSGPWSGIPVPDHGELWSQPWAAKVEDDALILSVHGVQFPYRLEKRVSFPRPGCVRIDYLAANPSESPFPFLWAAHPLFDVRPGTRLLVPEGIRRIVVSHSEHERLGRFGDEATWPVCRGIRLDEMGPYDAAVAEKFYFADFGPVGRVGLMEPTSGEGLTMRFPTQQVPYVAVWMNQGAYRGEYNVALEPATGFLDSLSYAAANSMVASIEPGGQYAWYLEVDLYEDEEGKLDAWETGCADAGRDDGAVSPPVERSAAARKSLP